MKAPCTLSIPAAVTHTCNTDRLVRKPKRVILRCHYLIPAFFIMPPSTGKQVCIFCHASSCTGNVCNTMHMSAGQRCYQNTVYMRDFESATSVHERFRDRMIMKFVVMILAALEPAAILCTVSDVNLHKHARPCGGVASQLLATVCGLQRRQQQSQLRYVYFEGSRNKPKHTSHSTPEVWNPLANNKVRKRSNDGASNGGPTQDDTPS